MDDLNEMANDPKHRRSFEKLLYLAAKRGDADLVAERLSWGINPNCVFGKNRTPLIANAKGFCPSAGTVKALLAAGADPTHLDETGKSALDYARRKLMKVQMHPRPKRKSPSLDENNQLQLPEWEQEELDRMRAENPDLDAEFFRTYWQERLRAARRQFNDPDEIEQIVELLEAAVEKRERE